MDPTSIMGTVGAPIVLNAFILNQAGKWKANNFYFDLSNFVGSAILVVYALFIKSYPFFVLNLVWASVSMKDVIDDIRKVR